jgi:pimeloyl-ACP methyl ester carboxylesterase
MRGRVRFAIAGALVAGLLLACLAQARTPYYLSFHPPTTTAKKGVVLVISGGGWRSYNGPEADQIMTLFIDDFRNHGYRTFNLAFRQGRVLQDTYAAVEHLKKRYPRRPLCVFGGSSGGHLALMTAIERRELVDCVIDIGGPIDFLRPEPDRIGSTMIRDRAIEIFGAENLRRVSPLYRAQKIDAATLVISATCDIYTSIERNREMVAKIRRSRLMPLREDPLGYNLGGHCGIANEDFAAMRAAELAWLDRYIDRKLRRR